MNCCTCLIGTGLALLLAGCATKTQPIATVGPQPHQWVQAGDEGRLEVFSTPQVHHDGNEYEGNPIWFQYSDYTVYTAKGKRVRRVTNSLGKYQREPSIINLPPGRYLVRAEAKGYSRLSIPVVIKEGRQTVVHLDGNWTPETNASTGPVVKSPSGYPIGWKFQ